MFGEFLSIVFKSIKLDKTLYSDNKNFGEAAIYFAGLIMILDGIAGAVAANTIVKTAVAMSGLTAILTWLIMYILNKEMDIFIQISIISFLIIILSPVVYFLSRLIWINLFISYNKNPLN